MDKSNNYETRAQKEEVYEYADQLMATTGLSRKFCKAGITQDHIVDTIDGILQESGIHLPTSCIEKGGAYTKEVLVERPKDGKLRKNKGHVAVHTDGNPVVVMTNFYLSENSIKHVVSLDDVANHTSFSMTNINEKGWLRHDQLPGNFEATGQYTEANAELRKQQMEQRKQANLARYAEQREQWRIKNEEAKVKLRERHNKAENAHSLAVQTAPTGTDIPKHGNHVYLQNKFGDYLKDHEHLMKDVIVDSIAFSSNAKPDEIYPLLVPAYNVKSGEMVALQRIMAEKEVIPAKESSTGKNEYITQYKEDGSPILSKKFTEDAGVNHAANFVHGTPGPNIKEAYQCEGMVNTWMIAHNVLSDHPDPDSVLIGGAFTAGNMGNVAADLRELMPDATLYIMADDDHKNEKNAKPGKEFESNTGLYAAYLAAEKYDAIVVPPPRHLLIGEQSDWDDVFTNVTDIVVKEAQKNNPNAKVPLSEVDKYTKTILKQSIVDARKEYNAFKKQLVDQASEKAKKIGIAVSNQQPELTQQVHHNQQQNEIQRWIEIAKNDPSESIMLASQDKEFKKLTIDVLETAAVLDATKDWSTIKPLANALANTNVDDGRLTQLDKSQRVEVLRTASTDLSKLLTDGKKLDAKGNDNEMIIGIISKNSWQASQNYINSFLTNLPETLKPGQQQIGKREPKFLTDIAHKTIAIHQQSQQAVAEQSAQNSVALDPESTMTQQPIKRAMRP